MEARARAPLPAREAYRLWADGYDAETVVSALDALSCERIGPALAGRALLDAGCGTARRLPARGAVGGPRLAAGVDLVFEMLAASRRRGAAPSAGENARVTVEPPASAACPLLAAADLRALPFRAGTFDVVWCRLAVGHVAELEPVYAELSRVARKGAELLVTDFHPEAARAGHARTFRDTNGRTHVVEHHLHEPEAHERVAAAAGWTLARRLDMRVGPEVRPFYQRAGLLARYEEQRGLPLLLALCFVR